MILVGVLPGIAIGVWAGGCGTGEDGRVDGARGGLQQEWQFAGWQCWSWGCPSPSLEPLSLVTAFGGLVEGASWPGMFLGLSALGHRREK